MLWSKLDGTVVKTPLGDKLGKIDDLVIDTEAWKVKYIVIKEGILKGKYEGIKTADIELSDDKATVSPEVERTELEKEMSSMHNLYLTDFLGKKVLSSDDEDVGKIYDIEIATELKDWEVWKVLIKTGFKERRLRISPSDILDVGEKIKINLTAEDVEAKSKGTPAGE